MRPVARVAAIASVGADTLKRSVACSSFDCARSSRAPNAGSSHAWIAPGSTGTTQPYVRAIVSASGSGVREKPRTPFASRIGGRRPPVAAKYEPSGDPRRKTARPTDVKERQLRRSGCAADLHELAARRGARRGQAPAAQRDPAGEPVDGAEVHECSAPRRLPEDGDGERLPAEHGLERSARQRVELRQREIGLAGDAAPDGLHRAVGRLERAERLLRRAVLHRDGADRGHREHGRGDRDAPLRRRAFAARARGCARGQTARARQAHRQNTIAGCSAARALGSRA